MFAWEGESSDMGIWKSAKGFFILLEWCWGNINNGKEKKDTKGDAL